MAKYGLHCCKIIMCEKYFASKNQNDAHPVFWKQRSGVQRVCSGRPNGTEELYEEVLRHLLKWTARARPKARKNCSFNLLHNNVLVHTATIVQHFLVKKRVYMTCEHNKIIRSTHKIDNVYESEHRESTGDKREPPAWINFDYTWTTLLVKISIFGHFAPLKFYHWRLQVHLTLMVKVAPSLAVPLPTKKISARIRTNKRWFTPHW